MSEKVKKQRDFDAVKVFEDEISKSAEKELERLAQMEKIEKERLVKFAKDQEVFYEKMGC